MIIPKTDERIICLMQKCESVGGVVSGGKSKVFLFEGQDGGQYSTRSILAILKNSKIKAGIKKKGCVHSLRHSFAAHLFE